MPAKDLGTKHVCFKCGTKFYDLKKPAPICPKCGADQRESPALKAPPERRRAPARAAVEPEPVEVDELEDAKVDEEEVDEPEVEEAATDDDEP